MTNEKTNVPPFNVRVVVTETANVVYDEAEQALTDQELLVQIANDVRLLRRKLIE